MTSCRQIISSVLVLRMPALWVVPECRNGAMLPIPNEAVATGRARTWCGFRDARMSGTAYGACVLHSLPESFRLRALAFVMDAISSNLMFRPQAGIACER